jgi:sugar lactone lactonase YvrE
VESTPIQIDVERQDSPVSLTANPTFLTFLSIGSTLRINVLGTFADGSTLSITNSSQTLYFAANSSVVTVAPNGYVTAVGPGQSSVTARYGSISTTLGVTVAQPLPSGPSPEITGVSPTSGTAGVTPITITGYGFGTAQGNGSVQLGSMDATTISSWSDAQIVATVPVGATSGVAMVEQNGLYSNELAFTVLGSSASTVVVTSLDSSIYPTESTTLKATVSVTGTSGAPTQTVSFMLGSNLLGTVALAPIDATDSAATLTLTGSQLTAGSNMITAVYSGDTNYTGSISEPITVTLLNALPPSIVPTNVGTAASVQTFTYTFSGAVTLSAVNILTMGASGLDYKDGGSSTCKAGTSFTAGQSCVVTVAFTPSAPGLRSGAVALFAQGSNRPLTTWYLNGLGQSSAIMIDPGTQSTIGTLANSGQAYASAIDGAGNVYVVDNVNSQVIKLAAGTFTQSLVVSSGLLNPTAVALDGAGNLYISDTGNSRVEVVPNEQGTLNTADISTVSISGLGSPNGLATDGNGNLYVIDAANGKVVEVPQGGGSQSIVVSGLTNPSGVAVDSVGNVYIAGNNQVAEYPVGGGTPILMGGGYNNPHGVAVDASGVVYVADSGNSQIVRVAPGGASQAILAFTGLTNPLGVGLDAANNVYVTNSNSLFEVNRTQAAALAFASTNVGSTSASQPVTVSDAGNEQLTLSNIAIPANFTQVPFRGTDCASGTQLAASAQCEIAIALAPAVSGPLAGTLTLTDNALNSAASNQAVQLSGTGLQVAQTITFPAIPNQTF